MIKWIVKMLLGPLVGLGEKYLDNQKDKRRLEHGTDRIALEADAAVRKVKLGSIFLSLPMWVAESSVAVYFALIMIDSSFPTVYINPLELPGWFKPHFDTAVISIFGLGAVKYAATNWNRR